MILALLVAFTTCCAVWCLTSCPVRRSAGLVFGFVDSLLWLFAGASADKLAIVIVAAFCALCFARPLMRPLLGAFSREKAHG